MRVASENMPLASTSVRSFTVLTEDDGSKFERDPENYTVEQLRRWLNIIIINIRGQIENRPLQNTRSAAGRK